MTKKEQPVEQLEDEDGRFVHVTWSRSGKRAILSVAGPAWNDPRQVTLTPDQVERLAAFLEAGPQD